MVNNNKSKKSISIKISKSKSKVKSKSKSPPKSGIVIKNINVGKKLKTKSKTKNISKTKFKIIDQAESKKLLSRINELLDESTSVAKNRVEPLQWVLPNRKEFPMWVTQTFSKYRQGTTGNSVSNGKPKPLKHQQFLRDYMGKNSPYRGVLLYHGLGSGKCHAKGEPIMMSNGSIKKVEDIIVGEELMGDDSIPRKVLSLARGVDKMYKISAYENEFIVNESHILCLKKDKDERVYEMSVKDYLELNNEIQNELYLFRVAVNFKSIDLEKSDDSYTYGSKIGINKDVTHIDYKYKCNDYVNRLKLLGGIIDSNNFDIDNNDLILNNNFSSQLIEDIVYVARSLGFVSHYYANRYIHINGDLSLILSEKYKLIDEKHSLNYSFEVSYINEDDYYGFTLDGNSRYLMGDFTVTHNTLSSIFISENLKSERNIVFLSPASLKPNFIQDGLMALKNPQYMANPKSIYDKYSFVSFNASNTPDQIRAIGGFDNKVIIIEETHNLVSKMVSGLTGSSKHGKEIYDYLMNAKNSKIIALTGSPAINDPFELAVLFNVLRGYIEVSYFSINSVGPQYGERWDFTSIMDDLKNSDFVDYLDFNKPNKTLEVHFTIKSYDDRFKDITNALIQKFSSYNIDLKFLKPINVPLFPVEDGGDDFHNNFVEESSSGVKLKNSNIFKSRILGLVSYYTAQEDIPDKIIKEYYKIPMSDYQYKIYEILREKERKTEKGSNAGQTTKGRKKYKAGTKSTFRVFSRQASNFVFPEDVPRPYPDPSFVVRVSDYNKNKRDNNTKLAAMIAAENKADEDGEVAEDYKKRINEALAKLEEKGNLYFRTGPEGLDKLSPKMKVMLENINASPGLVFVYSNFRSVEGVEVFTKVLQHNGYAKYGTQNNLPKYAVYSGTEDEKVRTELLRVFTNPENKYGKDIKIIMATSAGAEGLNLKNIRQVHIMEPYWNQVRIRQVIGRGVRYRSHIALLPEERNVEVFRYFSKLTKDQMLLTREKISTDEHIEEISMKKQGIIDELEQCLKEAAVDCMLNAPFIKGNYKCYNFGSSAKGFSYMPSLDKDLIYALPKSSEVKKVQKEYVTVYFNDKKIYRREGMKYYLYHDVSKEKVVIDSTKTKRFAVDPITDYVYDYKSVEESTKSGIPPILVGKVTKENTVKLIKK